MNSHHSVRCVGIYLKNRSTLLIGARAMGFAIGLSVASVSGAYASTETQYVRLDSTGKVFTEDSGGSASCIEDRNTGLIWELKTTGGGLRDVRHTYAWHRRPRDETVAQCAQPECSVPTLIAAVNALGLCGAADWRLPAREELRSIVDYTRAYPGPTINTDVFGPTAANFHWASDEDASDRRNAWGIGFAFGFDYAYPKENAAHVRLVRSARTIVSSPVAALANGTVRDEEHHVVWHRCSEGQRWNNATCTGHATRMTFAQAQSQQRSPWRLPTLVELTRLVDTTRTAAAINGENFPNTEAISYWSGTPLAGRPSMMWLVNFLYGDSFADAADELAAVRWVRSE